MTNLKCSVSNCTHNEEHLCCKNSIDVDGKEASKKDDTCCSSFCDCKGSTKNNAGVTPTLETNICCSATTCRYNENEKCHAKSIEVLGAGASQQQGTCCGTYEER